MVLKPATVKFVAPAGVQNLLLPFLVNSFPAK
jgi:hypothetical protein